MSARTAPVRLSIALVTRNRPAALDRALASVRGQSVQPYEIVVSDDSTDEYATRTKAAAERWDCRYVIGPRRGLYANRNVAAASCSGSHIRTMDDDHTWPEDHLALCIEAVRSDPRAIWTVGEISFVGDRPETRVVQDRANQLWPWGGAGPVVDPDDNWGIADGSTIYPREVSDRSLRMIEHYHFGSAYLEFGAYLYHHGFRSRCVRGAHIVHHVGPGDDHWAAPEIAESRLYASLCFNLYFKPSSLRAIRYTLAAVLSKRAGTRVARALPSILQRVRARWQRAEV